MKKLFGILAILVVGVLTSCGFMEGQDESLVGEWRWNAEGAYSYIFNEDGTGERGFPETRGTFTWSTRGDRLSITRDRVMRREIRNEVWTYEIYDGILTKASRQEANVQFSYVFDDAEHNEALLGTWLWDLSENYTYVFNADGTGVRGFPDVRQPFTWTASDERLNIILARAPEGEIREEMWTFAVDNYTLSITSNQKEDLMRSYSRVQ